MNGCRHDRQRREQRLSAILLLSSGKDSPKTRHRIYIKINVVHEHWSPQFMAFTGGALRPLCRQAHIPTRVQVQVYRSASRLRPQPPPPFPVIEKCPAPTCECAATPAGLDIDHVKPLSGTMPTYTDHVVICTGKTDWESRIEDEKEPNLARGLKTLLGLKGRLHDV